MRSLEFPTSFPFAGPAPLADQWWPHRVSRRKRNMKNTSPAKEPSRKTSRLWHLISPSGECYTVDNLNKFVRDNPSLFPPKSVIWTNRISKDGRKSASCPATSGFSNLRRRRSVSWKGWKLQDGKPAKSPINWNLVDWSESTKTIAKKLHVQKNSVSLARRRLAPHTIKPRRESISPSLWAKVDWSETTSEIARKLGCSTSSVSAARRRRDPGSLGQQGRRN